MPNNQSDFKLYEFDLIINESDIARIDTPSHCTKFNTSIFFSFAFFIEFLKARYDYVRPHGATVTVSPDTISPELILIWMKCFNIQIINE